MSQRFICALLTTSFVCCALAENNEFAATSEFVKKQRTGDKLLTNMVRARNSSKSPYPNSAISDDKAEEHNDTKNLNKQPRTANQRMESESRDNCCGPRYGSNSSTRPDSHYNYKTPVDNGRYTPKFGERLPVDRYGWHTQGPPPGLSGSSGKPVSGSHAGSAFYEGSQTGDRFAFRPSYGSENSRKPSGYDSSLPGGYGYDNSGYGGYSFGRPTGYGGSVSSSGYGISGTFANGDEFGPAEPNHPEGNSPSHPNIQAQKAVALKALAGVALIGAAAALATNPVLLPLGVVSGRKKRSNLSIKDKDLYMDYILTNLKSNATKNNNNEDGNKMSLSPTCIARFTCEIQKNYWLNLRKDADLYKGKPTLERRLDNLISNRIPNQELTKMYIKRLVKAAAIVAVNGGNCNTFTCTIVKNKENKDSTIFKI